MSKLSVKIDYLDDIRRFSLPEGTSWENVLKTVQNIFPTINHEEWQNIQIVYKDEEGDTVILSSDEELKEAIYQLGDNKILRLHIQKKICNPPPSFALKKRCGRKMCGQKVRGQFRYRKVLDRGIKLMDGGVDDLEKAKRLFTRAKTFFPSECIPVYNIACVEALLGNKEAALLALEESVKLGYDKVEHMENDEDLKSLRETEKFKQIISSLKNKNVPQNPTYGSLPNDIFSLFNTGSREALEAARQMLFSQLGKVPQDPTSAYNLACVEALLNNPPAALSHLQNSINLGYQNLSHILQDKDLKSLHPYEAFQSLVATLRNFDIRNSPQSTIPEPSVEVPKSEPVVIAPPVIPPSVEVPKPEPVVIAPPVIPKPEPVVASQPADVSVQSELQKGMQLLQEMGFNDIRANLIALQKAGGNVDNAISDLLDQF